MAEAGPAGLEAMLVFPADGARHPLALLSHGSPRKAEERPEMTANMLLPQATEFARRGWTAAIVMRRGYGSSGGGWEEGFGGCQHPDFLGASRKSVADLTTALKFLAGQPEVDATKILAVGQSRGGFSTMALAGEAPPGLVAAISFAGGAGSVAPDLVCGEESLDDAFRQFGKKARVPSLWIYAENDHFFAPAIARRFAEAFASGGNRPHFVMLAPFGDEGHSVFSKGIGLWAPLVDLFLDEHNLTLRPIPLPLPPRPTLAPPPGLPARALAEWPEFLAGAPHRAFARSPTGHWGWRSARRTPEDARAAALKNCGAPDCAIYIIDDAVVTGK
jgi:dienelactone hydrolase